MINTLRYIAHVLTSDNSECSNEVSNAICGCWVKPNKPYACYFDDKISIVAAKDSLAITATRKKNDNPFLGVDENGKCWRWHGEAYYLHNHIKQLAQKAIEQDMKNCYCDEQD